jgi:hypothetical protein
MAKVERDEAGWWVGIVQGIAGVNSQARRLDQLSGRLAEALAAAGVRAARVELEVNLPRSTRSKVLQAAQARLRAEQAGGAAQGALRQAAKALTGEGLSVRDAAALLGISFQRVHQLVSEAK